MFFYSFKSIVSHGFMKPILYSLYKKYFILIFLYCHSIIDDVFQEIYMEENFNIVGGLFRDIYDIFKKYYSNKEDECLRFTEEYYRDILNLVLKEIIEYNKFKRKIIREVKNTS